MGKVTVRVLNRPYRRTKVGGTLEMSRRDALIMQSLGHVEIIPPAESEAEVEFAPSGKLDEALDARREKGELRTPEAPVETVAHTEEKPKRKKRSRKKKGE